MNLKNPNLFDPMMLAKRQFMDATATKFLDSTLSYFENQLEAVDRTINMPLVEYTWGRDIDVRGDITMISQSSSFTRTTYAGQGSQSITGKPWISTETTVIPGVHINGEKVVKPVRKLARSLSYNMYDLQASALLGQPIDQTQAIALQEMYQLTTDEMVYVGDTDLSVKGLFNLTDVTPDPVVGGAWSTKTPEQILDDVNTLLDRVRLRSALRSPTHLRVPPTQFSLLASRRVGSNSDTTILEFVKRNNISTAKNNTPLDINEVKWLDGIGVGATDRMVAYTKSYTDVRFPMASIRPELVTLADLTYRRPYVWAFGELEVINPERIGYVDGI
jgi:hypothetical protein